MLEEKAFVSRWIEQQFVSGSISKTPARPNESYADEIAEGQMSPDRPFSMAVFTALVCYGCADANGNPSRWRVQGRPTRPTTGPLH